jgi:Domain of unknown function (DUF6438)
MKSPESPALRLPGAETFLALIATLTLIGAVPLCWWLADQRIIPWGDEARWMTLQQTTDATATSVADAAYIELDRQACFGSCPEYRVRITATGRVEYEGIGHVCVSGNRERQIDAAAAREVIADVAGAGFMTLAWHVDYAISDSATVFLTLHDGTNTRRIEHYLGDPNAPRMLRSIAARIDDVAVSRTWTPRIEEGRRVCDVGAGG